jgi:Uncharacterized protein conserved in bacteria
MASAIKVNHNKLEAAAKEIDVYVGLHKGEMKKASGEVDTLSTSWKGDDAIQFRVNWSRVDDKGSTSEEMIKALTDYAEFLHFSAQKYKKVQTDAINRANRIPKW